MPSKERVYLDYAAATPIDKSVQKRILQAGEFFANPSAQYHSALEASKDRKSTRLNSSH